MTEGKVIKSFEQDLPPLWHGKHLMDRLTHFIDNYVVPSMLDRDYKKSDARKISLAFLDSEKVIIKYKGEEWGVIAITGLDLMFVSKHD